MTFDLLKCLLNGGHCKTQCGWLVRIVCTNATTPYYPLVALVSVSFPGDADKYFETPRSYSLDGTADDGMPSNWSLTNL